MKFLLSSVAIAAAAGLAWLPATGHAGERLVVVELFTSEGCSSCPPAQAVVGRLARNPDILALSFHVDYWDYIGWEDSHAAPWATHRQRMYAARLSDGQMYTPQMVIAGRVHLVGSRAPRVMYELNRAIAAAVSRPALRIVRTGEESRIVFGSAGRPAEIYVVRFDPSRDTRVLRGENRGRNLTTFNVVRTYRKIDDWDGTAGSVPVPGDLHDQPGEVMAVIVQEPGQGEVVGAVVAE